MHLCVHNVTVTEFKNEGDGTFPEVRQHFVCLFLICYLLHIFPITCYVRIHLYLTHFCLVTVHIEHVWSVAAWSARCLLKFIHFHNTLFQGAHFSIFAGTKRYNYAIEQSDSCETWLSSCYHFFKNTSMHPGRPLSSFTAHTEKSWMNSGEGYCWE